MSTPLGHTDFSWGMAHGPTPALGHTSFSWGHGTPAPAGGESKLSVTAPSSSSSPGAPLPRRSGTLLNFCGEAARALTHYYVTTAINYTNGDPHVGHAYEAVTTDVIARYHRIFGRDVFFLTGTDEHGQKIAARATKEGLQPIDICDRYAAKFQALNKRLNISNDAYIRTTQDSHKAVAQALWRKCLAKGDIWLGTYSGWYDVGEETYVTDADAEKMEYKDKSGNPLKEMAEPSYLFNMEKYRAELLSRIKSDAFRIQPPSRRKEILTRLQNTELFNLSISRTNFSWGIPVPDDPEHVMYVWFDALTNYGSGVNFLDQTEANKLRAFWPATTHVIGKDIIWFHCVIWPIMLLSAEVPLPRGVFAHGFVNDALGKKMSKSVGNVVDPNEILDKYSSDTMRFYTICETTYGEDMPFSEEHLVDLHNANLADGIGNLLRRGLALCAKYKPGPPLAATGGDGESKYKGGDKYGLVPSEDSDVPFDTAAFGRELDAAGREIRLKDLSTILMVAVSDTNKYLTNAEPWKMKDQPKRQRAVVRTILEACYYFAHALHPLCPEASAEIFRQLKCPARTLGSLSAGFDNLVPEAPIMAVTRAPILFTKIERAKSKEEIKAEMKKAKAAKSKAKSGKKNGRGGGGSAPNPDQDAFTKIDIRVGQIAEVWVHENADSLYCEKIHVGEEEPRQVASGLRKHYPNIEDLQNRKVLVVCNLKSTNLVGFKSFGMVLCAVDDESGKTEIIDPPADAKVGERVFVEGYSGAALSSSQVKKTKAWRKLQPCLKTTEGKLASWDSKVIQTSTGPCKAASLSGVQIK